MFSVTTQDAAVLGVIQKKKNKDSPDSMDLAIKKHSKR